MDSDALRVLDLMRKLRALHGCGNRDDAIALYRYIGDAWRQIELANPWEGDEVRTAEAVKILLWMGQQAPSLSRSSGVGPIGLRAGSPSRMVRRSYSSHCSS